MKSRHHDAKLVPRFCFHLQFSDLATALLELVSASYSPKGTIEAHILPGASN